MLSWCFVSMNTLWPSFAPNKNLSQHSSQSLDVGLSPNLCAYPWRSYFQNVSWTLLMLIPLHIIVLWVSFYISFPRILTLPTLSMSSTDMCKHLKLPIFFKVGLSILRYLCHYPSCGIYYLKRENTLWGYTNADFAQDASDRCSIGAYIFMFGSFPISWKTQK